MENIITLINKTAREFVFLDMSIYSYSNNELVIGMSDDLTYYHKFEIKFKNVFAIICNASWSVNTQKEIIKLADSSLADEINLKHRVEIGNSVFQLMNEDEVVFYVVAAGLEFREKVVKYY
ncbi:hypothetical protein MKQ70_14910 [Chitinophaga sedimenti]|uniref:hypothetical protein n=1 Tax=Chitinophaga sedimenti TaxID=2033606 RepID=UPI002004EFD8|nr:hypothetical protein [Chitinophaga sedimenti]MCK7556234.1 hypothetical protein [Chitinophaga sedimenti]